MHRDFGEIDGTATFHDDKGQPCTAPFQCRAATSRTVGLSESIPAAAVGRTPHVVAEEGELIRGDALPEKVVNEEDFDDVAGLRPIMYVAEATKIPAWSRKVLYVRMPKAAVGDHDVLVTPLEGEAFHSINILVQTAGRRICAHWSHQHHDA